jgi:hypothetical protein
MPGLIPNTVGISPPGALGVAFFYYLTSRLSQNDGKIRFVERAGSRSAAALKDAGLRIVTAEGAVAVSGAGLFCGTMSEAYSRGELPSVLMICANPDQLFEYISEFVQLLEVQEKDGVLTDDLPHVPALMLLANGIYFQRVRQVLIEKLEESILLGRLADLWPDRMPRVVGRLLRGVTVQTALREGSGSEAVYKPGPPNLTTVAGGTPELRARLCELLRSRGGRFDDAGGASPTRVEFIKAFINLNSNLLGLIRAIDDDGRFHLYTLHEIYTPDFLVAAEELIRKVLNIGKAVHAFRPEETAEPVVQRCFEVALHYPKHVPSSLQWFDQQIRSGNVAVAIPPTEAWLLNPLLHYAKSAALTAEAAYLENLSARLLDKIASVRVRYGSDLQPESPAVTARRAPVR